MLRVQNLGFGFRHRRLFSDLTLSVGPGELVHLAGPNGAGKSTFMSIVAGLLSADQGTIDYLPTKGGEPADDRRDFLEYLPAEANGLHMKMAATQNLLFWARLRGLDLTREQAFQALDPWNLNHPLLRDDFPVEKFSTGMKRRLALARLGLSPAPGWLLDEPVYGLDAQAMGIFQAQLAGHLKKGGLALVISHDLKPLEGLVTRTVNLGGCVTSFGSQYRTIVAQGIRAELADLERLVSPILFAVTMLLIFSFAMGEIDPAFKFKIYLAETFVTAFFALQLSFSRIFEPDRQDRVFDLMRTYPVSHTAWFLAKYTLVVLLGAATLAPTMLFGAFLHQTAKLPVFSWVVFGIAFLALAGLAALGVLLSTMTLKANARQILYPLLYFPLTTPVLLAAVQASLLYLEAGVVTKDVQSWLGLLLAFNAIYFTLGVLLFTELVDES